MNDILYFERFIKMTFPEFDQNKINEEVQFCSDIYDDVEEKVKKLITSKSSNRDKVLAVHRILYESLLNPLGRYSASTTIILSDESAVRISLIRFAYLSAIIGTPARAYFRFANAYLEDIGESLENYNYAEGYASDLVTNWEYFKSVIIVKFRELEKHF